MIRVFAGAVDAEGVAVAEVVAVAGENETTNQGPGVRVFIYEFVTGGGCFLMPQWGRPSGSLLVEGLAMARAVTADALSAGFDVMVTVDCRLDNPFAHPLPYRPGDNVTGTHLGNLLVEFVDSEVSHWERLARLTRQCDFVMVIAPEIDGQLERIVRRVKSDLSEAGGTLLSPLPDDVAWAADKHLTQLRLRQLGRYYVEGVRREAGEDSHYAGPWPAVVKPLLGAGSWGVRRVERQVDLETELSGITEPVRVEPFCPGTAASIAMLLGPRRPVVLPPLRQRFDPEGSFQYVGGERLGGDSLIERTEKMARAVATLFVGAVGYIGVDVVLGDHVRGQEDRVIEVNPRLTTSYVGLRQIARENLFGAIVLTAQGGAPRMTFSNQAIQFSADGTVASGSVS
ncbi:MAG: ATP-grasp domain-containing protein [Pirellulaceae bacterium]|nr:ATP-grasp domain-containing protein [Planctomycetales bacterium]